MLMAHSSKLYTIKQYWKVHQSGHLDYFFDRVQPEQENEDETEDTPILEAVDDHLNGEIHTTQQLRFSSMWLT